MRKRGQATQYATGERVPDERGRDTAKRLAEIEAVPWLWGVAVGLTYCTAGTPLVIPHKLGRKPQGYWITDRRVAPIVLYVQALTDVTDKTITFQVSGGTGYVALWVY